MMKNLIGKILATCSLGLLLLSSCKKSDAVVAISDASTKPGTLTTSTTTPVLDRNNPNNAAITVTTGTTTYGYNAVVTYTLQVAVKGDNFAHSVSAVLTSLNQTFSVQDFNKLIIQLKLPNVATQYETRVQSSLSPTAGFAYSNIVTVTATAYPAFSYLYVVGSYQGYSTSSPDSLSSSVPGIYTGIINFATGNNAFLILPAKNFNTKYSTTTSPGTVSSIVALGAPNDLYAPATNGYYQITLNLNNNTISFLQVNGYSVIGSTTAGGNYSTDVDMKYINDGNGLYAGVFAFTTGAFKIRQNHDWTWSWGDLPTPDGKNATDASGKDIPVTVAGNYKVTFSIPVTKFGDNPSTTAVYTLVKQ